MVWFHRYLANTTDGEYAGYSASIVGNKSIEWIRKVAAGDKPWMVAIGNRASHQPFTPAPWYGNLQIPAGGSRASQCSGHPLCRQFQRRAGVVLRGGGIGAEEPLRVR